jgi:hypothetical protein
LEHPPLNDPPIIIVLPLLLKKFSIIYFEQSAESLIKSLFLLIP